MLVPDTRPRPTRKQHAAKFAALIRGVRADLGLNQPTMARRLGVAARTLSNWEIGYWLPPEKIRFHVLMVYRDLAPEAVPRLAEALGVPYDEKASRRFRAPPRVSANAGAGEAELRALVNPIVWRAAEAMDVRPNDLRAFAVELLVALDQNRAQLVTAVRAVRKLEPKGRKKR